MTKAEWLTGSDWMRMHRFISRRTTVRQARLLMVAFCRSKEAEFFDPRIPNILGAAERCADDPGAEDELKAFQWQLLSREPHPPKTGGWLWLYRAIADAHELLNENTTEESWDAGRARFLTPRAALADAVFLSLRESPAEAFTGGEGDAVYYCANAVDRAGVLRLREKLGQSLYEIDQAKEQIQMTLAGILREILGNPFRSVSPDPSWLTSDVVSLATQMYEASEFSAMPILADALQDAGCNNDDVLNHCRDAGVHHVRGCWVVDLLLGKQ